MTCTVVRGRVHRKHMCSSMGTIHHPLDQLPYDESSTVGGSPCIRFIMRPFISATSLLVSEIVTLSTLDCG